MKRFTETLKWDDPWYRRLPIQDKLLWQWLLDHCDPAGIIEPDLELAAFQIGWSAGFDTLPDTLSGRVSEIAPGKLIIIKFIEFQYGQLSEDCRPHKQVFHSLHKHGLDSDLKGIGKGIRKGINTLQDKDKDKDKNKTRGTLEDFQQYAEEIGLKKSDGESMFYGLESNGWMRGKNKVKCWRSHMRSWKAQGHHPSQKDGNGNDDSNSLAAMMKKEKR